MLNFIYYPVSWIMWVWHWLFDKILPNTPGGNGVAWALSVVFLVCTLRVILLYPSIKQIRTTRKMAEIQPQMAAIRKKYSKDRVKMSEEMQKLQREHGFNPLLGCLPMLLQIPVFIGLFHVLRSFNRMATGFGGLGMSAEQTRSIGNYAFSATEVQNFLDARLFGVPISAFVTQPTSEWAAFSNTGVVDFSRWMIVAVSVPLMILSSIATHMNARAAAARQSEEAKLNPQTRMMNNLALYIFPIGILVSGTFFPLAILLYWVSNNIWTYFQQHLVFGRIAKEEEAAKEKKEEEKAARGPKVGVKPVDPRKGKTNSPTAAEATDDDAEADGDSGNEPVTLSKSRKQNRPKNRKEVRDGTAGAEKSPTTQKKAAAKKADPQNFVAQQTPIATAARAAAAQQAAKAKPATDEAGDSKLDPVTGKPVAKVAATRRPSKKDRGAGRRAKTTSAPTNADQAQTASGTAANQTTPAKADDLAGTSGEADEHLAGTSGEADEHLAGTSGEADEHLAGTGSEADKHLAGTGSEADKHLAGPKTEELADSDTEEKE